MAKTCSLCILTFVFLLLASCANASQSLINYAVVCDSAFCKIVDESMVEINNLKKSIEEGVMVPQLGQKADEICNSAIEKFSQIAPLPDDDKKNEATYDTKIEALERCLDAPLHVCYLKQLSLLRDKALKNFKASLSTEGTEFEAMMQADDFFRREAEESTRQNPDWDYSKDTSYLKQSLGEIAQRCRKLQDVKLQAAKQTQQTVQYLQMQQQQMQAIQQQIQGSSSPWNIGAAYRVPDSNINLSLGYQQGRGNIQISCVPDEAISLLGSNGFVNGVTPGNIGISFNMNI